MAVDHNTKVMMQRAEAKRAAEEFAQAHREANFNRLQNNIRILELLADFMKTHEDLRFCQVLSILELDKDRFYEEPADTIKDIEKRIEKLEAL